MIIDASFKLLGIIENHTTHNLKLQSQFYEDIPEIARNVEGEKGGGRERHNWFIWSV